MSTDSIPPFYIEGVAAIGGVVKVELEECGVPERQKIVAELRDGKVLKSICIDTRGAKRLLTIIREYMQLSRQLVSEGEGTESGQKDANNTSKT